ncbi:SDR family oxidoreductase [Sporolactobacillus shoreicorticis]|uniref:SDR family NAD(P)-dependent oxidoreductase n=1 Tax=Sporolactobacillus shoreicorticis TaxID=1923877 RepID=A0ABW5S2T4_9BACL|nr:SDR family oxidoreductase [Sporolactobacillus shoreicorticis]MCO7126784.1 SDR family oxidoreductase [Sporolactobacillus shoreicorticis]
MFQNKIIVITGASSGVGSELARLFASKGAQVVLLARNVEKLAELQRQINIEGGLADYYLFDLTDIDSIHLIVKKIISRFHRIDVLINCAGVGKFELFSEMDSGMIDQMFAVNVQGLIHCTQAVLSSMMQQKHGCVVNIASLAGIITTSKSVVYGATKHAVIGFSNGLRMEVAKKGIRVIVVNPGPIRTPFLKLADPSGHYLEKAGRFMLDARTVAEKVIRAIERNKREINLPWYMGMGAKLYQLMPGVFEKIFGRIINMK